MNFLAGFASCTIIIVAMGIIEAMQQEILAGYQCHLMILLLLIAAFACGKLHEICKS